MPNQSSWGYFLEHLDLPYQFGILIMSTFCWNELFFTKANWIYAIWINVSPVFFASPLTIRYMYILYTIHIGCCCAHPNHTKPFIISIPLKAISNYECMNWVKKNNPKVSFWNSMAKNKDVLYLIFEIRLNDSNTTFFSFTVLWIGSKLWQNLV